ncbi:MAG: class I SAM-dependent rRNA methyltransferase [Oscillospiraceae bacterium]|nr:class I SAM-dependent rRNA methyltransferase [Oscillospiraceae bacterium]
MTMERPYPKLTVTPKGERALRGGHPWVYAAEVTEDEGGWQTGDIVDVYSQKGRWLGAGYGSHTSKIKVRLLSRNTNDRFDEGFYRRRIHYAVEYRRAVMGPHFPACRLVFGESDQLPGLTVDRYNDVLVSEVLCAGTDRVKGLLYPLLLDELGGQVSAVYERSDSPLRHKEGLPPYTGWAVGHASGQTVITQNGIRFKVDYINGQKTGFFLDQVANRRAVMELSRGRTVLDCFTHTGGFALHAAMGGAASVTAVDVSQTALDTAGENAALNGLENIRFLREDVFRLLTDLGQQGNRGAYDLIILDPPAFTRGRDTVDGAYRGYKQINLRAMKLLPRGGLLATCSCSHFMTDEKFRQMLSSASRDAAVSLRQVFVGRQAPDHPILWGVPETDYLKFYIFQVV